MYVVRVVQNRAPSELSYVVPKEQVDAFINQWLEENPGVMIHIGSMPLIGYDPAYPVPVEYSPIPVPVTFYAPVNTGPAAYPVSPGEPEQERCGCDQALPVEPVGETPDERRQATCANCSEPIFRTWTHRASSNACHSPTPCDPDEPLCEHGRPGAHFHGHPVVGSYRHCDGPALPMTAETAVLPESAAVTGCDADDILRAALQIRLDESDAVWALDVVRRLELDATRKECADLRALLRSTEQDVKWHG
jgi:hypothetical protein